jgi:hypothetical protein
MINSVSASTVIEARELALSVAKFKLISGSGVNQHEHMQLSFTFFHDMFLWILVCFQCEPATWNPNLRSATNQLAGS